MTNPTYKLLSLYTNNVHGSVDIITDIPEVMLNHISDAGCTSVYDMEFVNGPPSLFTLLVFLYTVRYSKLFKILDLVTCLNTLKLSKSIL